jgi:hypothetical protein
MGASTAKETVKAKKEHRCSWCAQKIDAGSNYHRWRYFGDDGPTVVKMHPECEAARIEASKHDSDFDEWPEGGNPRGCWCGFDASCTTCGGKGLVPNVKGEPGATYHD